MGMLTALAAWPDAVTTGKWVHRPGPGGHLVSDKNPRAYLKRATGGDREVWNAFARDGSYIRIYRADLAPSPALSVPSTTG